MTASGVNKADAQTSLSLHAPPPPHLPCVLVEEILSRLTVKHLRQLCCVCKSWNSLISRDSKFAKKHLHFSTSTDGRHHLAHRSNSENNSCELRLWKSPISSFFISEAASTDGFTKLSYPLVKLGYEEVSTCDGILCFGINQSLAILCNPSIRKFNNLLPPLKKKNPYHHTTYSLVYDRFIDKYKIIALSSCRNDNKIKVNVHTLGTNYWRKIQDFPYHCPCRSRQGIFVSDTVNWLVYDTHSGLSTAIVSLDLEKESYQQLLQPESLFPINYLLALRDCLCIFSHSEKFSDIWIMKEYENEKSWTKLLRVPYIGDPYFDSHTTPLFIYDDSKVLMKIVKREKYSLAAYDGKNNTYKIHEIRNIHEWIVPKVYVESLTSPFLRY